MMPAKMRGTQPHDRAMQYADMSKERRSKVEGEMAETGSNAVTRIGDAITKMASKAGRTKKEEGQLESLRLAQPVIRNRSVTPQTAANRRTALYGRAVAEAPEGGDPHGAGWYFAHHKKLADMGAAHGIHHDVAITASAVMSPNNKPDNELAATHALMQAQAHDSVTMTPKLHKQLSGMTVGREKVTLDRSHIGKTVALRDLHPSAVAALSGAALRESVPLHTTRQLAEGEHPNDILKQIGRGGTKENITKAVHVLRGNIHPDDAINPQTAPKVWSYRQDTRNAVHNSPEHVEYMSRVGSHATGNEALDLYGLRHSTHGILDPKGPTAEDTWQNSITSGQKIAGIPTGRQGQAAEISAAKTYGSHVTLGGLSNTAEMHAFNNNATHMSAAQLSRGTGFELPAMAAQEVPWTQIRKEAGKDSEHNQAMRAAAAPPESHEIHGQLDIFGGVHRAKGQGKPRNPNLNSRQFGGI